MDQVISVENVSKYYKLGTPGSFYLRDEIRNFISKVRGKEYQKRYSEEVCALHDINFNVKQGEIVGFVGKNGAGKSTLLKILSRTTGATSGTIKFKGRVASLLEVGTGFHPDLTGRENIFVNGAILGMTKKEIHKKFDEIVDFAGIERYIDTPVKRYSSGMYVRLAFSIAAHLEPEILIVDEVLAVGDVEFQNKSLGKMKAASENGRTILFVSHNMGVISDICSRALLIKGGTIAYDGDTNTVIRNYINDTIHMSMSTDVNLAAQQHRKGDGSVRFSEVTMLNENEKVSNEFMQHEYCCMRFKMKMNQNVDELYLSCQLRSGRTREVITSTGRQKIDVSKNKAGDEVSVDLIFHPLNLKPGLYEMVYWIGNMRVEGAYDILDNITAPLVVNMPLHEEDQFAAGYFDHPFELIRK
jgi:lipopolysaccharide transport system ATP-binding protein